MNTAGELDSAIEDRRMTLKEFAAHFGASNWRKGFVLAIEKHVPNGAQIVAEEKTAFEAYRQVPSAGNKLRLKQAQAAKAAAKQQIIDMFQLHIDA